MTEHVPKQEPMSNVEILKHAIEDMIRGLSGFLGGAAEGVGKTRADEVDRQVDNATGRRPQRDR